MADATGVRPAGQAFESCPAATGVPSHRAVRCGQFPDGAHRCGSPRSPHPAHTCTCGYVWRSESDPTGNRFRGETK